MEIHEIGLWALIAFYVWAFLYLTYFNQVYGVDSWFWLKIMNLKPIHFNLAFLVFIFFVMSLFYLNGKDWKLLSLLFLINLFSLRFIEVEPDDFLMYAIGFTLTLALKKVTKYYWLFPLAAVLAYGFFHNFFLKYWYEPHLESAFNLASPIFFFPAIYLLLENRKLWQAALIFILFLLFPTPKFASNALPLLIFAFYLDLKSPKCHTPTLLCLLTLYMVFVGVSIVGQVKLNLEAFEKYCNRETKICNNTDINAWHYGHYFAYLGYKSMNPAEFGVFCCKGIECLSFSLSK